MWNRRATNYCSLIMAQLSNNYFHPERGEVVTNCVRWNLVPRCDDKCGETLWDYVSSFPEPSRSSQFRRSIYEIVFVWRLSSSSEVVERPNSKDYGTKPADIHPRRTWFLMILFSNGKSCGLWYDFVNVALPSRCSRFSAFHWWDRKWRSTNDALPMRSES